MDVALSTHRMHVGLLIAAHVLGVVHVARGHGYMIDPPARASAWREFPGLPRNFDDNAIRCGGQAIPADGHGRCGVCGDPLGYPADNEAGGRFATGLIVRHYKMGQVITMKAMLTANHWGWMEFKICPNNDVKKPVTLECLDKHVLQRVDGLGSRINITTMQTGEYKADYKLPDGMVCSQCVVQWRYHAGNSWGVDPNGKSCLGCGAQEEFRGCADVSIEGAGLPWIPTEPPVPTQPPQTYTPVHTQPPQTYTPVPTQPPQTLPPKAPVLTPGPHRQNNAADDDKFNHHDNNDDDDTKTNNNFHNDYAYHAIDHAQHTSDDAQHTSDYAPVQPPPTTYITRVVCKAINNWAGNDYLDRWCSDACARGNCPPDSCKCSEVQQVITLTTTQIYTPMATEPPATGSPSPSVQYTKVCKAISLWKDIDVFDIWCTAECNNNNKVCPAETCACTDTPLFPMARATSTQMPTTKATTTTMPTTPATGCWANSEQSRDRAYWDTWCQATCDRGSCSVDYCICHFK